jgi:hypothetical protein
MFPNLILGRKSPYFGRREKNIAKIVSIRYINGSGHKVK